MHIQMFCEKFVFVKDLRTNWTRKCFCDDTMHRSTMPFQICLICIRSITILLHALVRFFTGMNLANKQKIQHILNKSEQFEIIYLVFTYSHVGLPQSITSEGFAACTTRIWPVKETIKITFNKHHFQVKEPKKRKKKR